MATVTDPPLLSSAVRNLQPSATMAAAQRAKQLTSQGVPVLEFTLGEPDFDTPNHVREAAKAAIDAGHTHYTPATGLPELRQAVCRRFDQDHNVSYAADQIAVSNGAKHAIHNVLTALCGPGDEVVIPAPYWVSYAALVRLTGATPVIVSTKEKDGFCMQPEAFAAAISDRTRVLMINNPSNPTGGVYPEKTLRQIADIAVDHGLRIISDEIYEKLIYDGFTFHSIASLGDRIREHSIIVSGVSKAYAMTGWRIGWTMASPKITAAITKLQGQQTSNPCSISQHAAVAALSGPQDCVTQMCEAFAERRRYVLDRLGEFPEVSVATPGGAFYAFINVSRLLGRRLQCGVTPNDATQFCEALLDHAHVALVSGEAFGAPGYVRLSFATDLATLEAGLNGVADFIA